MAELNTNLINELTDSSNTLPDNLKTITEKYNTFCKNFLSEDYLKYKNNKMSGGCVFVLQVDSKVVVYLFTSEFKLFEKNVQQPVGLGILSCDGDLYKVLKNKSNGQEFTFAPQRDDSRRVARQYKILFRTKLKSTSKSRFKMMKEGSLEYKDPKPPRGGHVIYQGGVGNKR
jgi:hypothetical protein